MFVHPAVVRQVQAARAGQAIQAIPQAHQAEAIPAQAGISKRQLLFTVHEISNQNDCLQALFVYLSHDTCEAGTQKA